MENQDWIDMLDEYPGDPTFIKLYALQACLCTLIDQGWITVSQGTEIFKQQRDRAIIEQHTKELRRALQFWT